MARVLRVVILCVFAVRSLQAASSEYHGLVSVSGTTVTLLSGGIDSYVPLDAQAFAPMSLCVTAGKGFGQVRYVTIITSSVLVADSAFAVDPTGSTVSIRMCYSRALIYGNDVEAGSPYPNASNGIVFASESHDILVRGNTVTRWRTGVAESSPDGPYFWNEYSSNTVQNCGEAGVVLYTEGDTFDDEYWLVGPTVRHNRVWMDTAMPTNKNERAQAAFGFIEQGWYPFNESDTCAGYIIEDNISTASQYGLYVGPIVEYLVFRNNTVTGCLRPTTLVKAGITSYVLEGNTLNQLPTATVQSSKAIGNCRQEMQHYYDGVREQGEDHIYVWDQDGSGSLVLSVTDGDGNWPITGTASSNLTWTSPSLTWNGVGTGVNAETIAFFDGTETITLNVWLFVGGTYIDCSVTTYTDQNGYYTVETPNATLVTTQTVAYSESATHTLDSYDNGGIWSPTIRLKPEYQEIGLSSQTTVAASNYAALAVVKTSWLINGQHIALRLTQDANNYYELWDLGGHSDTFYFRRLRKIIGGVEAVDFVTTIAAHNSESPFFLMRDRGTISAYACGYQYSAVDTTPLDITGFQLIGAVRDRNSATDWMTFDDLYFIGEMRSYGATTQQHKWTSITSTCEYVPTLEWNVTPSEGSYDENSTETITGDLLSFVFEPGASENTFQARATLSGRDLLTSGSQDGWITCGNKRHILSIYNPGINAAAIRFRATGLDDVLRLKIRHTEGL